MKRQPARMRDLLAAVILLAALLLPRLPQLDRYATPDEPVWLRRSGNFYYALAQRDYANTFQREHPGVTAMWAGTLGFLIEFPEYRGLGQGYYDSALKQERFLNENGLTALEMLKTQRAIMVWLTSLTLMLAFWLARKLVGLWPALAGFMLLALEPFFVGLTRLLHLDGLLGSFMLLSIVAFVLYLRERQWPVLLISAGAAGLACLTKTPGLFTIPAAGLLALGDAYTFKKAGHDWNETLRRLLIPALIWGVLIVVVFVALFPAMWVQPAQTLTAIFTKSSEYATEGHSTATFFEGEADKGGDFTAWFYPLTVLWRATPLTLLGLAAALWAWWKKRIPGEKSGRVLLAGLVIEALVFMLLLNLSDKQFDRYAVPAYPPLGLAAGLGWFALFNVLAERAKRKWFAPAGIALVVALQAASAGSVYPYYLSYYDPLMGGNAKAPEVMQIGWGEGLNEAGAYLSAKPGAEDLRVMSWYPYGPFSYYFVGETVPLGSAVPYTGPLIEDLKSSDYLVVYIHQWQRELPAGMIERLQGVPWEHSIWIDGLEYARIYKVEDLPESVFP